MKRTVTILIVFLIAAILAGCGVGPFGVASSVVTGSGNVRTEDRQVSNFTALNLTGVGDVTITQGDSESFSIEAEDNLIPLIETEVRGGVLLIGLRNSTAIVPRKNITMKVGLKKLDNLTLSGAGNIHSAGITSDRLSLTLTGAGGLQIDKLSASQLTLVLSGTGGAKLAGEVSNQTATLSGVGNYSASELKSSAAKVAISGAGDATVWATDKLDATISGVGSVKYYGSPSLTKQISGAGQVQQLGQK
jgi:hypothetical protein